MNFIPGKFITSKYRPSAPIHIVIEWDPAVPMIKTKVIHGRDKGYFKTLYRPELYKVISMDVYDCTTLE